VVAAGTLSPVGSSLRELFRPEPGVAYLDSATYGLPPRPTFEAMSAALEQWQAGSASWVDDWDVLADRARVEFAHLAGLAEGDVALVPSASVGVGTVAASLTHSDHVVVPDDEFTSLLFPVLVAEQGGTTVEQVPFGEVADRIAPATTLVATSLVQMQTGRLAELDAIVERARAVGARVLVDATHGLPFVGMGGALDAVDFVVCAAYKHLLCPRGVAFLVVREGRHDELAAWNANWRSASDPYGRYVGGPLTLASGAARFDVSVAWLPWVGAATSLALLRTWNEQGLLDEPRRLARELAVALGVEWHGSSIVCAPVTDLAAARSALDRARVRVGFRGGAVRLSTHVYTVPSEIERAVDALRPLVKASPTA
jgi:selenocysteine lyase/cysteine desulfurase